MSIDYSNLTKDERALLHEQDILKGYEVLIVTTSFLFGLFTSIIVSIAFSYNISAMHQELRVIFYFLSIGNLLFALAFIIMIYFYMQHFSKGFRKKMAYITEEEKIKKLKHEILSDESEERVSEYILELRFTRVIFRFCFFLVWAGIIITVGMIFLICDYTFGLHILI